MRIETALARRDRAISQLRDLYSSAKFGGMLSRDMDSRVAEIRSTTLAKAPRWTVSEFEGYRRALKPYFIG